MITVALPRGSDKGVGMCCNLYVNVYGLKRTLPQGDIDGALKIMTQLINGELLQGFWNSSEDLFFQSINKKFIQSINKKLWGVADQPMPGS